MRVLVLGVTGMLGHKLWQVLNGRFDTWGTARTLPGGAAVRAMYGRDRVLEGIDATDMDALTRAFDSAQPDVVVNCIGIVKQAQDATRAIPSISTNALFPHQAAALSAAAGARFIHISTDCVFDGSRGAYTEADVPDAADLYGRSKNLGEVTEGTAALTLRTSIIGRELHGASGLVEWFLSNRPPEGSGRADGYDRAIFSGLTTLELSRTIATIITSCDRLHGLYHVSAEPINKYDLLVKLNEAFRAGISIHRSDRVVIDRSLDSWRFRNACQWTPPDWDTMIAEMAADPTSYESWRRSDGT